MALTLSQLLTAKTRDDFIALILSELQSRGFPVTNWVIGGMVRSLLETLCSTFADFSALLVVVTQGGLLEESSGDWLTLLSRSNFKTIRKEATFAEWDVTLACSAAAGPYTIVAGQLWATTAAGRLFNNLAGGVLATSGTLVLRFKAESSGVAYNSGPITALKTTLPGVSISLATLIESAADQETDPQLIERAQLQWALLAIGATDATYKKWALDSDVDVRRVRAKENTPAPGQVTVWIARQDGPATGPGGGTDQDTVQAYLIDPVRKVLCVTPVTTLAVAHNVTITGTALIRAADLGNAQAVIGDNLLTLFRALDISDGDATTGKLFRAEISEVFMALPGMKNFTLNAPAADVTLAEGEIAVLLAFDPLTSITWTTF